MLRAAGWAKWRTNAGLASKLEGLALIWVLCLTPTAAGQSEGAMHDAPGLRRSDSSPALVTRPRYHVEPSDVITLTFPLNPEFDQSVAVNPDGYVSLRAAGELMAGGKSLPELRDAIRNAYAGILRDSTVSVELKDFHRAYFTVSGEVAHPGNYDLHVDLTAAEALAFAGGASPNSKMSQILLFRRMPGGSLVEVRKLNMSKMLKKGTLEEDVRLQPGDLLYVPKTTISKIARYLPSSSLGLYEAGIP